MTSPFQITSHSLTKKLPKAEFNSQTVSERHRCRRGISSHLQFVSEILLRLRSSQHEGHERVIPAVPTWKMQRKCHALFHCPPPKCLKKPPKKPPICKAQLIGAPKHCNFSSIQTFPNSQAAPSLAIDTAKWLPKTWPTCMEGGSQKGNRCTTNQAHYHKRNIHCIFVYIRFVQLCSFVYIRSVYLF